jgi:hypothetical protein
MPAGKKSSSKDGLVGKTAAQRRVLAKYRTGKSLSVSERESVSEMTAAHRRNIKRAEARALRGKG